MEIPEKNEAPALEIPQNCVIPIGIFKAKNQDPWIFHMIFSSSPLEIPLFIEPQNFDIRFF